ncbi:MAG TPA: NAD(P)H-hydrate dehydratase [Acidimicrobiales bacterium]|jgi:NAD(P)H-hydrate epimerase|nr:NAD(P)H-hydrate dehydratase [Acidimicrobiales bacterium]
MRPVLTVAEMNAVDARAAATTPLDVLVGRAGTAVAVTALEMLGGGYGRRAVVIAGRGNNGADGRVAAQILTCRGVRVQIVGAGTAESLGPADLVIDAAYGTGFHGEYTAPATEPGTRVLAVDIPSGVEGDTGRAAGSPLGAERTVTFVALKPGLLQGDGVRLAGRVTVADIGLPPGSSAISMLEDADVSSLLAPRPREDNKWSAAVLVVAGSPGMVGAASLCARAAYRSGAGMVRLGVPGAGLAGAPASEAVSVDLPAIGWSTSALEVASRCAALVVGPGLGRDPATAAEVVRMVQDSPVPVVVDADGLFALGRLEGGVGRRGGGPSEGVILTPHDGEYRRLMGESPGSDRVDAARRLASASGAVGLLKGSTTAVADPSGRVLVGTSGSPKLATAGTGDVLSGVIAALIARGVAPPEAAGLAAHVHGRAGGRGPAEGLVAGDLPELVSEVLSDARASTRPVPPRADSPSGCADRRG